MYYQPSEIYLSDSGFTMRRLNKNGRIMYSAGGKIKYVRKDVIGRQDGSFEPVGAAKFLSAVLYTFSFLLVGAGLTLLIVL